MKKIIIIALLAWPFLSFGQMEIKCLTYNIRLDHAGDLQDNWQYRRQELASFVRSSGADFVGLQEALHDQYDYVKTQLFPTYRVIGVGRDDGKTKGEYAPIYYKSDRWKLVKDSTFWLSQTPTIPSKGWDANLHRICTFGIFEDLTNGDTILVSNVHFDHQAVEARKNSVTLLEKHIGHYTSSYGSLLMGDFNLEPSDSLYSKLTSFLLDARQHAKAKSEISVGTFNGFKLEGPFERRIDFTFYQPGKFLALKYESLEPKTSQGRQLSDHFPVMTTFLSTSRFKARHFDSGSHKLPYRLLMPEKSVSKMPLFVFMHGRGESGTDNWKQLIHGSKTLINAADQFGAMVIAPQCGTDDYWATVTRKETNNGLQFDFRDDEKANPGLNAVMLLIDSLTQSGTIDPDRIYIAGLSMGGMGTWELLWRMPGKFTAAAPICGGGLPVKAGPISKTPIWSFHGVKDNVVQVYHSIRMLEAVQKAGGKAKITLYENVGHNAWDFALEDPEFLTWMFSKSKNR